MAAIVYTLNVLKNTIGCFLVFLNDALMFVLYSSACKFFGSREYLLSLIMAKTHSVEKRLTFYGRRAATGRSAEVLVKALERYKISGHDQNSLVFRYAVSVLKKYNKGQIFDGKTLKRWKNLTAGIIIEDIGGVKEYSREEFLLAPQQVFKDFFSGRHSVREFEDKKVSKSLLFEALEIARKSPSICNRQPVNVYFIENNKLREEVVRNLTGVRGFEDKIHNLCAVTADLGRFYSFNERYEGNTNAGIFLMSLLLAFHYLGIGACTLNWDVGFMSKMKVQNMLALKRSENIVAFIAYGFIPEKCLVPVSLRRETEDLAKFIY